MLEDLNLTLYEIFGYLLPGFVALAALALMFSVAFLPAVPLPLYRFHPDVSGWVLIVVASYVLGHVTQAVGNVVLPSAESRAAQSDDKGLQTLLTRARERAGGLLDLPADALSVKWLIRIADQYCLQHSAVSDRDMYIYREGFYKGSTVSFSLLSLALAYRILLGGAALQFQNYTYQVTRWQVLAFLVLTVICSILSVRRFMRFGDYRIWHAITGFVVASKPGE